MATSCGDRAARGSDPVATRSTTTERQWGIVVPGWAGLEPGQEARDGCGAKYDLNGLARGCDLNGLARGNARHHDGTSGRARVSPPAG